MMSITGRSDLSEKSFVESEYYRESLLLDVSAWSPFQLSQSSGRLDIFSFLREQQIQLYFPQKAIEEHAYQPHSPNLFSGLHITESHIQHSETSAVSDEEEGGWVYSYGNLALSKTDLEPYGFPVQEIPEQRTSPTDNQLSSGVWPRLSEPDRGVIESASILSNQRLVEFEGELPE